MATSVPTNRWSALRGCRLLLVVAAVPVASAWSAELAVEPEAPPQAKQFSLHDVRLLDGPFKAGEDAAVQYLLNLEPDRFLANFRKEAGLEPKAQHYGGWESQTLSGHTGGHYLSACALAYAATGQEELLRRVNYIVDELAECQQAHGDGYVAAIPGGREVYAEIARGDIRSAGFDLNGLWVPNYNLHKLFAGLLDAYQLCDNQQALDVAKGLADWFHQTHSGLSEEQMQQVLVAEHGGINESFAELYALTGDQRYLELSQWFHHREVLDPLARGVDILPGKHANTQIPKIVGVARRHELTGTESDRAIADFFWERVVNHHSYVTGGHCNYEHFGPPDELNDRLSTDTTETCNVYNMLKLTEHVFGWNPDAEVADFYERALLNHIRSAQHPDGRVIYNLSLQPGHHKTYQSPYDAFTCCVGTGMENHVKYGAGIYYHGDDGLWVNLFIPSELSWNERGVTIRQETDWPYADTTRLTIATDEPQQFKLRLRQPHWVAGPVTVTVNGEPVEVAANEAGYVELERRWQSGDQVELHLPMDLRTEAMPDNSRRIAIFHGPTVLAANLGPVDDPRASEPDYVPVLVTDDRPVDEWVEPRSLAKLEFRTTGVGRPRDVDLEPFFALHDRRYTVYLDIYTQEEWETREAELRAAAQRAADLAARTIDELRIGEMQSERDHQVTGEQTTAGDALGRKWRHATDGGWFEFQLEVDPEQSNELLLTYWGGETGNRVFDVLVDGEKIDTQRLQQNQPGEFFDVSYVLSDEQTSGKQHVTVRLDAHDGAMAGGLFGAKMLRAKSE